MIINYAKSNMTIICDVAFLGIKMDEKKTSKKLKEALINKALGYTTQEVTEEYGLSGDEFVLQKRKTSTKSYPPDLSALQMLLDGENSDDTKTIRNMSDEELNQEKERLLNMLKEEKDESS